MKYFLKKTYIFFLAAFFFFIFTSQVSAGVAGGRALDFNGNTTDSTGIIQLPINSKVNIGSTDFTIEWWTKIHPAENIAIDCNAGGENWKHGSVIFDRDISGPGDKGKFGISLTSGKIAIGISTPYESYTLCGVTSIDDNMWHSVTVTRTVSGLISLFIDGQLDSQYQGPPGDISYNINRTTDSVSDPFLYIGGAKPIDGREHNSFIGMIDEVRISNIKRYTNSFTSSITPFTSDASTISLFHFDECNDSGISDTSQNFGGSLNPTIVPGGDPSGPIHVSSDVPLSSTNFVDPCITPTITPPCPSKSTGDANCDTIINLVDYEIWRKEYTGISNTLQSDFIANNKIEITDFEIWRRGYLNQ